MNRAARHRAGRFQVSDSYTPPVFIIGSERSGTNLLRIRLASAQGQLAGPPPAHFLKYMHAVEAYLGEQGREPVVRELVNMAVQLTRHHYVPWDPPLDEKELLAGALALPQESRTSVAVMHLAMQSHARECGRSGYICKDNETYGLLPQIVSSIPDARFIYLYRDPRDVVLSEICRPRVPRSVYRAACRWRDEQDRIIRAVHEPLVAARTLRVSYEELVANEPGVIGGICSRFGLSGTGGAAEPVATGGNPDWSNLGRETLRYNTGKFRDGLSARAVAMIEGVTWNQMKFLGYTALSSSRPRVRQREILADRLQARVRGWFSFPRRHREAVPESISRRRALRAHWHSLVR